MYCNLSKNQALPMALRVSSQPKCSIPLHTSKFQYFSNGVFLKPSLNPSNAAFAANVCGSSHRVHKTIQLLKPTKDVFSFGRYCAEYGLSRSQLGDFRGFSSMHNSAEDSGVVRGRKSLPWLADCKAEKSERVERVVKVKAGSKSPWEVSAEKLLQNSSSPSVQEERRSSPQVRGERRSSPSFREERRSSPPVRGERRSSPSFREERRSSPSVRGERRNRPVDVVDNWQKPHFERNDDIEEEGDDEVIDNPRWNKIKSRVDKVVDRIGGPERPEMRRWDRQETWGKKTYREAHESTVPKMVGEGIYGVGPVLAALTAGRREFYTLYVQEGLELNKNNKKKKDKKGFEKVLKVAEKLGLSLREISKHDLNMVSDNRPHQGLVLDCSPLDMVSIKELDPASHEDRGVLWVALDEVTDPQNLGAIIRSSYFFGASGVVLCAKNSAPLSGVVSKASAGSLELMEIRSCKNMMQFLTSSSENGWRVIGGSVSSGSVPLREVVPGEPTILVLGSEGTGLRPLVERSCTQLVKIPGNIPVDISLARVEDGMEPNMENQSSGKEFQSFMAVESLNVSVAAGVLLHHFIGDNYTSSKHEADVESEALD